MNKFLILTIVLISVSQTIFSQGTIEDYNRAYSLREKYNNKIYYSGIIPEWIGNSSSFWYIRKTPTGKSYILADALKLDRKELFDPAILAGLLSTATGKTLDSKALQLDNMKVSTGLDSLSFDMDGVQWIYFLKKNKVQKGLSIQQNPIHRGDTNVEVNGKPVRSPDGKKEARIQNFNVIIKDLLTGFETALSRDGSANDYYSADLIWSPDSKKLACFKVRPVEKRLIYFIESSPKDQLQPKLQKREYVKPGDALPFRQPRIFNTITGETLSPITALFHSQYLLHNLQWNADSKAVTFEYNQRGHQVYRVLELSAVTGNVRILINETSNTYINYNRRFRQDLKNGSEIIWMSERDNWNHLYLYDSFSGMVKKQITKGEWYVREVLYVDERKRIIYFTANGMVKGEDPYLIRYYRINMDGKDLTCLTPEEGMHHAWFSNDRNYLVDVYTKTNVPSISVLRSAKDGHILLQLEKADIRELEASGWKAPETFVAKGRDGKTDMWGLVFRPTNFDPLKKYPIIEYIYSGPGNHYVPKVFLSFYPNLMPLAELGFIVVQVDAMSTSFRSKSFESICYKNLKDAGLPDRMEWIKAAAKQYPYMDTTRVGIFGSSAGGQESMTATLFYPEFYKAAYSSCGCHDNRMDKIWWNEQWMGYPVDESYKLSSNVENAHLLKTPLMLVVGEVDDNVDPASTMQVVNALVKAGKDFELVVLPGVNHTMGGDYGEHKRFDFFVKNLLGVNPPSWNRIKPTTGN